MQRKAKKYLHDMGEACRLVVDFIEGKSWNDYQDDVPLQSAVERQCQILGEALHQLHKNFPSVAERIPDHRDIINFRHVLVHGYDKVENEVVWGVANTNVPKLLLEVEKMLNEA